MVVNTDLRGIDWMAKHRGNLSCPHCISNADGRGVSNTAQACNVVGQAGFRVQGPGFRVQGSGFRV